MTNNTASGAGARPGRRLGDWGEQCAADHLIDQGWQVIDRNWRCEIGELDLIALEPVPGRPPIAVAVEVKSRGGDRFGDPLEAITWEKRARLRRLLAHWVAGSELTISGVRVDAIGITKRPGRAPVLRHVRGAA